MRQAERRPAACGVLAPAFALRHVARPADAAPVRLRDLRQRRPAILALLPGAASTDGDVAWLRAIAERGEDLAYYGAAIYAIAPAAKAQGLLAAVDVSFPLLADEDGATLAAYLGGDGALPALAVIDRYSQLVALLVASGPDAEPDLGAALRELAYADQQDCACTLPAWEE